MHNGIVSQKRCKDNHYCRALQILDLFKNKNVSNHWQMSALLCFVVVARFCLGCGRLLTVFPGAVAAVVLSLRSVPPVRLLPVFLSVPLGVPFAIIFVWSVFTVLLARLLLPVVAFGGLLLGLVWLVWPFRGCRLLAVCRLLTFLVAVAPLVFLALGLVEPRHIGLLDYVAESLAFKFSLFVVE